MLRYRYWYGHRNGNGSWHWHWHYQCASTKLALHVMALRCIVWHGMAWHGMALYFTVMRYTKQHYTEPHCMALCCARDEAREVGWLVSWRVILGAYPIVSSCPNRRCFFIVYVLSSIETLAASLVFRLALIVGAHLTSL